jgi:hypothetical protein
MTVEQPGPQEKPMLVAAARYYPSTGMLAVADSGGFRIHVHDVAAGKLVRSVGRQGRGPNELRAMTKVSFLGDTIVIMDRFNSRASLWSTAGFINSRPLPTEFAVRGELAALLSSGDALMFTLKVCPKLGQVRDTSEFFIVDSVVSGASLEATMPPSTGGLAASAAQSAESR